MGEENPEGPQSNAPHARNQATVADFLRADLDLAFTFLSTARMDAGDDPDHVQRLLARASAALAGIRRLSGLIEDRTVWGEVHSRADELERALTAFGLLRG